MRNRFVCLFGLVLPLILLLSGCSASQSQSDAGVPKAPPVANTAPGGGMPPGVDGNHSK